MKIKGLEWKAHSFGREISASGVNVVYAVEWVAAGNEMWWTSIARGSHGWQEWLVGDKKESRYHFSSENEAKVAAQRHHEEQVRAFVGVWAEQE